MTACIVGWAHTPFGKMDAESVESLIVRVTNEALDNAGIDASEVDEIVLGHYNAGFSAQDFTASLVLQARRMASSAPVPLAVVQVSPSAGLWAVPAASACF